ncbi:hypothetical protein LWI29_015122 [Acer saccharum]|uniref:Uncharacterized protein n=1 Tax=Acer saccharum TaxID=4024 RepID=A0AA39TC17_ACESA|nr:hypothetical protein LWI29_015122 [Acer saccharum]
MLKPLNNQPNGLKLVNPQSKLKQEFQQELHHNKLEHYNQDLYNQGSHKLNIGGDNILCHYNKNDQDFVKSGYWLGRSLVNMTSPFNTSPLTSWWNTSHNMSDVISWSMNFLQEFRNSNTEPKREVVFGNIMSCIWILLDKDAYKDNYDTMLDHVNGRLGVDMVIRNSDGLVLATCSMAFEGTFCVKTSKLIAIPRCLQFGNDYGLVLKTIEFDEATTVKWINEGYYLDFDFGANKMANGLGENALRIDNNAYWMEDYPHCIKKEVEADMPE